MRLVILGGGFCGAMIAKHLDSIKNLEITLIDKKPYFEYSPSLPKVLFNPSHHQRIIVPFSRFLKHTRIVTDPVLNVAPEYVKTEKETISFNMLVISTGIDYPIFLKNKEHVFTIKSGTEVAAMSEKVAHAKHILIIGGGVIGTEIAGEFATRTKDKHVVLVHPHDRLLERNTKHVSLYAKRFLEERGIELIFGEKVVDHRKNIFVTDKKRKIEADIGIWCAGVSCNPWFLTGFSENIVTERKALRVNQHLQLNGYPQIFVGGDINDVIEEKTAHSADKQARIIIENILRLIKKKPLIRYMPHKSLMAISLGNWDGILLYPPFVLPGFIPGIAKQLVEKIGVRRF